MDASDNRSYSARRMPANIAQYTASKRKSLSAECMPATIACSAMATFAQRKSLISIWGIDPIKPPGASEIYINPYGPLRPKLSSECLAHASENRYIMKNLSANFAYIIPFTIYKFEGIYINKFMYFYTPFRGPHLAK